MISEDIYTKVTLRSEKRGKVYVEVLWAIDLGEGKYRLENLPYYFYGLAYGDIIAAEYSEKQKRLLFREILEPSGHKLLRVIFRDALLEGSAEKKHLEKLMEMGCRCERANPKYFCLDIPPNLDFELICDYLSANKMLWEHATR